MARFDFSKRGKMRVYGLSAIGTLFCMAVAFGMDSISFSPFQWHGPLTPIHDVLVPLMLAPGFFGFLLFKLRELEIAHCELMMVATTDGLTQLLNRRAFTAVVETYLAKLEAQHLPASGAFLVIDVDHFKRVNDNFGHNQGDEALKLIAASLRHSVRDGDVVGRMGGEEFAVFLPGVGVDVAQSLSERIRAEIRQAPFQPSEQPYSLSVSVGGVTFAEPASFTELYKLADERLYSAKNDGRDRVNMRTYPRRLPDDQCTSANMGVSA